jgi:hypothetical protein
MALESAQGELQLWFRPCRDRTLQSGVMSSQSLGTPTGTVLGTISGLQLGSPGKNSHLYVASTESYRVYYMGEGGGWTVVSLVCQSASGLSQHPRVFSNAN